MVQPCRSLARAACALVLTLGAFALAGAAAQAATVNGFAYQNLGDLGEIGRFYERSLDTPYARLIVAWDAADDPSRMSEIGSWIDRAQRRGREVLISFDSNGQAPPDVTTYRTKVDAFRRALPSVHEYTAWNEPNHTRGDGGNPSDPSQAALAAGYWKALNSLCGSGSACTVTAGDFHDPEVDGGRQFATYVANYKAALATGADRGTPTRWAIHPYRAIDAQNYSRVYAWIDNDTGSADVWLTESGSYVCKPDGGVAGGGGYTGDGTLAGALEYQQARVQTFKTTIAAMNARVSRVYYYHLGFAGAGGALCSTPNTGGRSRQDSGLLGPGDVVRPAFRTLFPSAPAPRAPDVATTPASGISAFGATLNGFVDPETFDTTYHFDWGDTLAYGATTPEESAGAGPDATPRSHRLTGLAADTVYHYRVVARNVNGTSTAQDISFRTGRKGRPAAASFADGTHAVYFRDESGSISQLQWSPGDPGWTLTRLGGAAAGDPAVATRPDGSQYVYFRGVNDAIWELKWTPGDTSWRESQLPGQASGDPAVAILPDSTRMVYYRDLNGGISQLMFDTRYARQWQYTRLWEGNPAGDPAVAAHDDGSQFVYFRNWNDQLIQLQWTPAYPTQWYATPLIGHAKGDPAVANLPDLTQLVYYRDVGGGISQLMYDARYSRQWSYTRLWNGTTTSDPAAEVRADGSQFVYFRNWNNQLFQIQWTPAQPTQWYPTALPGHASGDPTTFAVADGSQFVYYPDTDGGVAQLQWSVRNPSRWDYTRIGGLVAG